MRINLGTAFAHLFQGENRITVTIKVSKDGIVGMFFIKRTRKLFSLYLSRQDMRVVGIIAPDANVSTKIWYVRKTV
jgi:hypothetical protein